MTRNSRVIPQIDNYEEYDENAVWNALEKERWEEIREGYNESEKPSWYYGGYTW